MNLKEATALIAFENTNPSPQVWLDLGCGTGLFTVALAGCLPSGSKIIAVDKDEQALKKVPAHVNNVVIEKLAADFINHSINQKEVDGVLMANSLHYVNDKESFLKKLFPVLGTASVFMLVEYDRNSGNPWVPYPLNIDAAKDLFKRFGYSHFRVLNKRPSVYSAHALYSALISP